MTEFLQGEGPLPAAMPEGSGEPAEWINAKELLDINELVYRIGEISQEEYEGRKNFLKYAIDYLRGNGRTRDPLSAAGDRRSAAGPRCDRTTVSKAEMKGRGKHSSFALDAMIGKYVEVTMQNGETASGVLGKSRNGFRYYLRDGRGETVFAKTNVRKIKEAFYGTVC